MCWRSCSVVRCSRAVNPQAGKKGTALSHPPTPPPALLPPFGADLPGQPSPSLHSFSCALLGRLFLHLLLPHVLLVHCLIKQPTISLFFSFYLLVIKCILAAVQASAAPGKKEQGDINTTNYCTKVTLCITSLALFHLLLFLSKRNKNPPSSSPCRSDSDRQNLILFLTYPIPDRHLVTNSQQRKRT